VIAARVVIMIGRNRYEAHLHDGFLRCLAFAARGVQGEVHHHDDVRLDDPDQHDDADASIMRASGVSARQWSLRLGLKDY
jgi:hypothetical protein